MTLEKQRWTILALLCVSTAINYIDRQALSVLLPTLRTELGITSVQYGTIATFFMLAYTVGQMGAGPLIDRVGTRRGFSIAISVWSVAAMAHAFVSSAAGLGVLRVLLGIGEAGNWPAGGKAIAEWFPKDRRAFAMGVFDGGSAAGAILAPPIVAGLALTFGWRAAFVVTGAIGFLWLAAWLRFYHNPAPAQMASAARKRFEWPRGRRLWGLMLTRMIATPVWWFYVFWLPDYLGKDRGFTLAEIGMFGWIPFLTVDLGKLAGGGLSDYLLRRGWTATLARKSVMGCGALAMAGGIQVVGAPNAAAAIAWVSLATFGFGLWSANILALHADIFPSESMATAVGWTGTAASLGGAGFTYGAGWMVQHHGYGPVFWAAGTAALVALLSLVFLVGRVERA